MKIYSRGVFAATWPWLFVLLFAIVPLLSSNRYLLELAILFFVWSAVVTHWNLLIGHAGIFSLVQLAIFNLGGYFTGVIGTHLKIGPVYTLVPAGLFCAFAGFLVGLPCLRLRGAYVALLTLAAHFVVYLLIFTNSSGFTGGGYGLYGFGDYGFRKLFGGGGQLIAHYYVALVLLIICVLAAMAIINSPLGLAFRALRNSESLRRGPGHQSLSLSTAGTYSYFILYRPYGVVLRHALGTSRYRRVRFRDPNVAARNDRGGWPRKQMGTDPRVCDHHGPERIISRLARMARFRHWLHNYGNLVGVAEGNFWSGGAGPSARAAEIVRSSQKWTVGRARLVAEAQHPAPET